MKIPTRIRQAIKRPVRQIEIPIGPGIAFVPLTIGKVAMIDAIDIPKVEGFNWSTLRATKSKDIFYATRRNGIKRVPVLIMHRVIADAPKGMLVDHKNGDSLDNRASNLRLCTHRENMWNSRRPKTNTTGYTGISRTSSGRWKAQIGHKGVFLFLGARFPTAEAAALAYDAKAKELRGEFARLNFPEEIND